MPKFRVVTTTVTEKTFDVEARDMETAMLGATTVSRGARVGHTASNVTEIKDDTRFTKVTAHLVEEE